MPAQPPSSIQHVYLEQEDVPLSPEEHRALVAVANNPITKLSKGVTGFGRAEITRAFNSAFEMIGGVPRLAVWADQNPTEFYKLYAKLLPSSSQIDHTGEHKLTVEHVLPRPHDYRKDADGGDGEDV
jgi:hypothetical protein